MIECKNITFSYYGSNTPVLEDVNIRIDEHTNYLIKGDHGSGKTTLLKLLASQKHSLVEGELQGDILHFILQKEILFYDTREINHFFYDRVFDEMYYSFRSLGYPKENIRDQIAVIMSYFQIEHWVNMSISKMSKGQKQYLQLILRLATRQYRIMVLDEPFLYLDQEHIGFILQYLEQVQSDYGTTFIISDHHADAWKQFFYFEEITLLHKSQYSPWLKVGTDQKVSLKRHQVDCEKSPLSKIQQISLMIDRGKTILIYGANGTVKTSLCKFLMGMYQHDPLPDINKRMLLEDAQSMFLYAHLQNEWPKEVSHPYPNISALTLSYGQQKIEMFQRVIHDQPELLILDDPFDGINQNYHQFMQEKIGKLVDNGTCVVMTNTEQLNGKDFDETIQL